MIGILSPDGSLLLDKNADFSQGVDDSPELTRTIQDLHGVFRFAARKMIVERLETMGLM